MSGGIIIKFDFDKLPANGERCQGCQVIIIEIKYVPFLQIGDPVQASYFPYCYCETCYNEMMKE